MPFCANEALRVHWSMAIGTVYRAFNPADAHVVRSRLEAAGFHAVVTNELSALSLDGYAMAAGGILVQVPASEQAEAELFLKESRPVDESE
jgi:hypothetical protein